MKRFDFANDVAKQLITITSAIITVVIAFYEKFFSHHWLAFSLVFLVLFVFIASITLGVLAIGGLVNLVERQEGADARASSTTKKPFIQLGASTAQILAMWQQGLFALGLAMFACVAIADRLWLAPTTASAAPAHAPIVWTQLRPDTDSGKAELIARTIVARDAPCPALTVNGAPWPMETRSDGADPDFPIRMCEAALPGDAPAQLGNVPLKPRRTPHKIVVIGDTGCRITDYTSQPCDRADGWPFFRIAQAASAMHPDLVIHVGDYHYREKPCAGRAGCSNSPYGDNWRTWDAEFFTPAAPLLTAAPWLMLRGNHEDCQRAGAGWNLLIRPQLGRKPGEACPPDADPDVFTFDRLHLVVPDTASAGGHGIANRFATYRKQLRQFDKNHADRSGEWWLLTHQALWVSYGKGDDKSKFYNSEELPENLRPIIGEAGVSDDLCDKIGNPMNTYRQWIEGKIVREPPADEKACALLKASANPADESKFMKAPPFSFVLSGDTHTFQMFKPGDAAPKYVPVQIVVGNGGDALERNADFPGADKEMIQADATLFDVTGKLWMRNTFGFAVLERPDGQQAWLATLYDVDGKPIAHCALARSGNGCKQP